MVMFTLVFTDYRVEIAHKVFCVDDTISVIRGKDNKFHVKAEQSVEKIQETINRLLAGLGENELYKMHKVKTKMIEKDILHKGRKVIYDRKRKES